MAAEPHEAEQQVPIAKLDYQTHVPEPKRRSLLVQTVCLLIGIMAVLYGCVVLWRVVAVLFGF